jgi:hypothetical protein
LSGLYGGEGIHWKKRQSELREQGRDCFNDEVQRDEELDSKPVYLLYPEIIPTPHHQLNMDDVQLMKFKTRSARL